PPSFWITTVCIAFAPRRRAASIRSRMAGLDGAANGACKRLGVRPGSPPPAAPDAGERAVLRAEEGEYREHAAVVVAADAQAELVEDARDVLLHGPFGDHQALRNPLLRAALGHQLEHLALARGHACERGVGAAATEELRDDRRIDCRAAFGDPTNGRDELLHVAHA